ncbi:hypothetical protein Bca4012_011432 [Brassica carinata]
MLDTEVKGMLISSVMFRLLQSQGTTITTAASVETGYHISPELATMAKLPEQPTHVFLSASSNLWKETCVDATRQKWLGSLKHKLTSFSPACEVFEMHRSVLREDLHIRSRLFYSSSAKGRGLLQILIISSLHLVCLSSQQETRFVYESFLHPKNLYLDGSAKVLPDGQLQLTNTSASQIGHAFYKKPIQFSSSGPLTFSTHFVCALVPKQGHEGGHGLAFLLSSSIDFSHAQATRYVGTFNASTNGSHVLAVELDTIWNPEFNDVDNNHVGIDVNNPVSVGVASASYCSDKKRKNESMNLLSGKPIQVWVDYEALCSMFPLLLLKSRSQDALLDATDPRLGDEFIAEEVEMVMKLGLLCSNIVPESRPTMEHVVLYLNKNLPMPDFSPYTLGIGTFAPFMADAASLLALSASWSWSGPPMSSSSCQPTDQPWSETKNSLHVVAEPEKPKT